MNQRFISDKRFELADHLSGPGTIVIAATGEGNGSMRGHVGILGENGLIMSSDSSDGLFKGNYDVNSWFQRYAVRGGFPIHYYKLK